MRLQRWFNDHLWRPAKGYTAKDGTWKFVGSSALLFGAIGAVVIAGGGAVSHHQASPGLASSRGSRSALGWREPDPPTTTTSPPVTIRTTVAVSQPKPQAAGGHARPPQPASAVDDAFWRRLANCESPNGANGGFNGYFQLAGSTAKAVGYHGGSYDEQLAAAKRWLTIIGVAKAGTRAGWPICWWVALRG